MHGGAQACQVGVYLLLVPLVGPEQFGISTLAVSAYASLGLLVDGGLSTSLVRAKGVEAAELAAVQTVQLGMALLVYGGAMAWVWTTVVRGGVWFGSADVTQALLWLGPAAALDALMSLRVALLQRRRKYRVLAIISNIAALAGALVAAVWVWFDASWRALVAMKAVTSVVSAALHLAFGQESVGLTLRVGAALPHLRFSVSVLGVSVTNKASTTLGNVLVGGWLGPDTLGLLRMAKKFPDLVATLTSRPIRYISLPFLAEEAGRNDALVRSFTQIMRLNAVITVPAMALGAVGTWLVAPHFGEAWRGVEVIAAALFTAAMLRVYSTNLGAILYIHDKAWVRLLVAAMSGGASLALYALVAAATKGQAAAQQALWLGAAEVATAVVVSAPMASLAYRSVLGAGQAPKPSLFVGPAVGAGAVVTSAWMVSWVMRPRAVNWLADGMALGVGAVVAAVVVLGMLPERRNRALASLRAAFAHKAKSS